MSPLSTSKLWKNAPPESKEFWKLDPFSHTFISCFQSWTLQVNDDLTTPKSQNSADMQDDVTFSSQGFYYFFIIKFYN